MKNKSFHKFLKFSFSSSISGLIDYFLYSLILILNNNLIIANIIARLISSIINFTINKSLVFQNSNNLFKQIIKYYTLVIIVLMINTTILSFLSKLINPFLAKIIIEFSLFLINYFIQKKVIFRK